MNAISEPCTQVGDPLYGLLWAIAIGIMPRPATAAAGDRHAWTVVEGIGPEQA